MNAIDPRLSRSRLSPRAPQKLVGRLLLRLGAALHRGGVPAHRLEGALRELAAALGVEASFFSTPTQLLINLGASGRTHVLRVEPGDVDLARLADLDALAAEVVSGRATPQEALRRLDALDAAPQVWSPGAVALAGVAASASAAPLLGGGLSEAAVAGLAAGLIAALQIALGAEPARRRLLAGASGFVVALLAWRVAAHTPLQPAVATLAGLIVLVPGLTLTIAVTELATRHMASGSARLLDGLSTLMQLAFGSLLGASLARWMGPSAAAPAQVVSPALGWLCVAVAGLAFAVLFQAHRRHAPIVLGAGLLGWGAAQLAAPALGPVVAVFVASGVVGVVGNGLARWQRLPASLVLVPGLILLVPGATGFASIQRLLAEDVVAGVSGAFSGAMLCCALAAGLLVAHAVVPPRRAL